MAQQGLLSYKCHSTISRPLVSLHFSIAVLGRLYSAMWPGPSVTAKGSQLQTLVDCSKGPEEAIAQIKPTGNLLVSRSTDLYIIITWELGEWQSLSPTPRRHESGPAFNKVPR